MRSKNNLPLAQCSGKVYSHTGRGTSLGYPTANIQLTQPIEHGVYISRTLIGDQRHASVTFIGVPTLFSDQSFERAETHILEGRYQLVGKIITIELLKFLRPIKKFSSIHALIQAIQQDVAQAKTYFADNKN